MVAETTGHQPIFTEAYERRRPTAGLLSRLEIVEQAENPIDVAVLVVEAVEGAGEAHRVARIVAS
jgi:hypothetical protein